MICSLAFVPCGDLDNAYEALLGRSVGDFLNRDFMGLGLYGQHTNWQSHVLGIVPCGLRTF